MFSGPNFHDDVDMDSWLLSDYTSDMSTLLDDSNDHSEPRPHTSQFSCVWLTGSVTPSSEHYDGLNLDWVWPSLDVGQQPTDVMGDFPSDLNVECYPTMDMDASQGTLPFPSTVVTDEFEDTWSWIVPPTHAPSDSNVVSFTLSTVNSPSLVTTSVSPCDTNALESESTASRDSRGPGIENTSSLSINSSPVLPPPSRNNIYTNHTMCPEFSELTIDMEGSRGMVSLGSSMLTDDFSDTWWRIAPPPYSPSISSVVSFTSTVVNSTSPVTMSVSPCDTTIRRSEPTTFQVLQDPIVEDISRPFIKTPRAFPLFPRGHRRTVRPYFLDMRDHLIRTSHHDKLKDLDRISVKVNEYHDYREHKAVHKQLLPPQIIETRFFAPFLENIHTHGSSRRRELKYVCLFCGHSIKNRTQIIQHLMGLHFRYCPHECDDCDRIFCRPADLKKHRQDVHSGESVPCSCGKEFSNKRNYIRHQRDAGCLSKAG